jgi:hypothetical protein
MDVRDPLTNEVAKWPEVPTEMVRILSDAGRAITGSAVDAISGNAIDYLRDEAGRVDHSIVTSARRAGSA